MKGLVSAQQNKRSDCGSEFTKSHACCDALGRFCELAISFAPGLEKAERSILHCEIDRIGDIHGPTVTYSHVNDGVQYFFIAIDNAALTVKQLREMARTLASAFDATCEIVLEKHITPEMAEAYMQQEAQRRAARRRLH